MQYFLQIITCDPSIYTMDHPDFIVSSLMEDSIGIKCQLTLYIIEKPFNSFANRADPDQAALTRAA